MSDTVVYGPKQLAEVVAGDGAAESFSLNSVYEIVDALEVLKRLDQKVEFLKGLKKHRAEQIDAEIADASKRAERLRSIILTTMQTHEPSQKTLSFTGTGKVSRRVIKGSWEITDEDAVIQFMTARGLRGQVVRVKESLDVKSVKSLLDDLSEQGIVVPGTKATEDREGLSVSFVEEKEDAPAKAKKGEKQIPTKPVTKAALDELDELEV
jgi:phage host-nuclease inhibitor protein Gam